MFIFTRNRPEADCGRTRRGCLLQVMRWRWAAVLVVATSCFGQADFEIGGLVGYGVYRDVRVNSSAGNATAGIRNRFVAGASLCEDLYEHLSGELRYVYQDGDPFLSNGTVRSNIQGQSHTVGYDLLIQIRGRDYKLRPYVAVGAGGKFYRTTGPEPNPQPLPQIARLIHSNEWRLMTDFGFGVKYRAARHIILRADFRDYITPFPKRIFAAT